MTDEADGDRHEPPAMPSLADMQHWTGVIGRAQQMILEHLASVVPVANATPGVARLFGWGEMAPRFDMQALVAAQSDFWRDGLALWQRAVVAPADGGVTDPDRRFAASEWRAHPAFDLLRQSYGLLSDLLLRQADAVEGLDARQRDRLRFATRVFVDAIAPANFPLTNPQAWQRMIETRGDSLIKGMGHLLADIAKGQVTHTRPDAFELGRDLATTPGKVILETPLFQLIQYAPATETVQATPLLIFPPWINRFYILDLGPKKSFVRWAVEQGITVFMVSWKSADASLADTTLDDYVSAQLHAIDTVRELLDVPSTHVIGYCVAGTVLAATLALLAARGEADKVASATFLTAQVDFEEAGDLRLFVDDALLDLTDTLTAETGFLDGRYMAAVFNMLRGRDLIWAYVVNHYLLGEEHSAFDLLHWNGDTTNLPARWHQSYLRDFYRDNLLVAGAIRVHDTAIDLTRVATPAYVQAGREDHIAPAASVWKLTRLLRGPVRFVLAGSGHIAGVVNPPATGKYQYWTCDTAVESLEQFKAEAQEHAGSWWPDWSAWITARSGGSVRADGARLPGGGVLPAIEDAPGRYVRER